MNSQFLLAAAVTLASSKAILLEYANEVPYLWSYLNTLVIQAYKVLDMSFLPIFFIAQYII